MNKIDSIKILPHSIEAEQSVLGGLMLDSQAFDRVLERIKVGDFYRKEHQYIFEGMLSLLKKDRPCDVVTLDEELSNQGKIEQVGGFSYLGELAKNTPSVVNIGAYADIVHEYAVLRDLIQVANEIADTAFSPEGKTSKELLDSAEQKVFAIAQRKAGAGTGPQAIKGLLAQAVEKVEKLSESDSIVTGLGTSYNDLDRMTTGLHEGELIIVAGRPSMGKTSFAMNIAEHAAMTAEKPVLVFSMEMPGESLAMRMLSSLGRIDQHRIRTGHLTDDDWARVTSSLAILTERLLFIDDTPALTVHEVRARARRIAREHGGLGLVVIDYLQLMQGDAESRTMEISNISRGLKALAKELSVPVIALSQLNRGLEQRPNKRPVMSDLRESGAIEQDADLILFIYRDEVYHEDSPDKGTAEIIIAKQRNGPIGKVRLTFLGACTRFENFAGQEYNAGA